MLTVVSVASEVFCAPRIWTVPAEEVISVPCKLAPRRVPAPAPPTVIGVVARVKNASVATPAVDVYCIQ